jgi:hypothetical protein
MTEAAKPVWHERLGYLIQEAFDYIGKASSHHRDNLVVRAVPVRDGDRRIVYRYGVRGDAVPYALVEELRDVLGRARSLLDNAMFTAATDVANPPLTEKQERRIYFPIATTADAWDEMASSPHMKALSQAQRDGLRAIQPFETGNPVVTWFQEIHNTDKHRRPLVLAAIPDPEFVMMFLHLDPPYGSNEYWVDWVDPLPPIANRVEFVEYRTVEVIRDAGIEDVPVALAIWVDNGWRDIQHMLWDVLEFTTRAAAYLSDGDLAVANSMKAYFDAERSQLAAFKKMMVTGDPDAEAEWLRLSGATEKHDHERRESPVRSKPPASSQPGTPRY